MVLPPKSIESIEKIAEKLDSWANDKKRHKMLCNGLPGLGCRTSLSEPLRGFRTVLLKLKCWNPEVAKEVETAHRRLLSSAKEIDQKIKSRKRGVVFDAFTTQLSAYLLIKKLQTVAEMAGEVLPSEKLQETTGDSLTKSQRLSYMSYQYAINQDSSLAEANDNNVYAWLKENGLTRDDLYKLPSLKTWKRYVRHGRKANGAQKNTPRAGRSSHSIVNINQIDHTSSQK